VDSTTQGWSRLCGRRSLIERRLGLGGGFGEEIQKEEARLFSLTAGRLKEAAQDAVVFQSPVRAGAVDDFAHNDHRTQTALGLIVSRGHLWMAKGSDEAASGYVDTIP